MALTRGAGRSAAAGARMTRRRLRASSWAGAACWAERGARLGWRQALGRARRKGEASWAGGRTRPAGRKEEGRGKMNFAFFFFHMDFQSIFK